MVEDSVGVEDGPNIRKRIGQRVIYGVSGYMKRNGLEDSGGVEDGPNIRKRIGQTVIYGESRYMKRNGLEGWVTSDGWRGL